MGLPERVIQLARSQVGVKEEPTNSSNVLYNTLYYGGKVNDPSLHWCVVFVWWIFRELQASDRFFDGEKTASCGTFLNWARMKRLVVDEPMEGALVLFDWTGDKKPDHIEIVTSFTKTTITSIGGNTGPKSDSVMLQTRNYNNVLTYVWPYREEDIDEDMEQEKFNEMLRAYRADLQDNDAWGSKESEEARQFCIDNNIMVGGDTLPDGSANYMWQDFLNREQMAIILKRFNDYIKGLIANG